MPFLSKEMAESVRNEIVLHPPDSNARCGTGAVLVASYSCALHAARQLPNFPDDVKTYSLVSSLWTAAFAIGSFLGTSLAGVLFDHVGWQWSCVAVQALIFVNNNQ